MAIFLQGKKSNQNGQWELRSSLNNEISICKDRAAVVHNFQMVENAAKLLGIAPEVGSSDILLVACIVQPDVLN